MRVLLASRIDQRIKPGGDGRLIEIYRVALTRAGAEVVVTDQMGGTYDGFDVVHLFNLDSSLEPYLHARRIRTLRRRPAIVLTPLYQQLAWATAYYRTVHHLPLGRPETAAGLRYNAYQSAKDLGRYVLVARRRPEVWARLPFLVRSCYSRKRAILRSVDGILVHATSEAAALWHDFAVQPAPVFVLPVGRAAPSFAAVESNLPQGYVACVGRIEPLKNQLAILEAADRVGVPVVFVGRLNRRHARYCRRFLDRVRPPSRHVHLPYLPEAAQLNTVYRDARAHVLASWAEVWPLVTAEALAAGCPVATTANSYERETLGDLATYADPAIVDSVAGAIEGALAKGTPQGLAALRAKVPTWEQVARELLAAYDQVARAERGD